MNTVTVNKGRAEQIEKVFPYTSFDELPIYDQRYMPRWQTNRRAYYRSVNSNTLYRTQLKDLHLDGACICAFHEIQVNQKLDLKILLSSFESVEASGTVIWKRTTADNQCYAGVAFDPLTPQAQDRIVQYAFE